MSRIFFTHRRRALAVSAVLVLSLERPAEKMFENLLAGVGQNNKIGGFFKIFGRSWLERKLLTNWEEFFFRFFSSIFGQIKLIFLETKIWALMEKGSICATTIKNMPHDL